MRRSVHRKACEKALRVHGQSSAARRQVFGIDGVQSLDKVREKLAYCPQHNILHDTLSVWEHMQLYGALRNLTTAQIEQEATELLTSLQICRGRQPNISTGTSTLFGGRAQLGSSSGPLLHSIWRLVSFS